MEADQVPFGIVNERDKAVIADGEFLFKYFAAVLGGAGCFDSTIETAKVYYHSIAGRTAAIHFYESTGATGEITFHGEGEHFDDRAIKGLEFNLENVFVKDAGAGEIIDVNFKPADGISLWVHDGMVADFELARNGRWRDRIAQEAGVDTYVHRYMLGLGCA